MTIPRPPRARMLTVHQVADVFGVSPRPVGRGTAEEVGVVTPENLRCPYCGGSLFILTEYVGPAYLSENTPTGIECNGSSAPRDYGCGAEWECNGELRTPGRKP